MKLGLRIARYLIVVAVFNFIFFLIGDAARSVTDWVAYAFTHVAVAVSFVAPVYCINYKRIPENLSVIYVFAWMYTLVTAGVNLVFLFLKISNVKILIIINVLLLALYIIQLTVNLKVNHEVEKNLETMDAEREFIRGVSAKLKVCMESVKEQEIRTPIEKAYDAVRTSPLYSNEQVMNYEIEVIRLVNQLQQKMDEEQYGDVAAIAEKIVKNVKKRNAML